MASLINNSGLRSIQWTDAANDKRPIIRLGRMAERPARLILSHVESLITAKASASSPPMETAAWMGRVDAKLHAKLSHHGLIEARLAPKASPTLKNYFDEYAKGRTSLKASSIKIFNQTTDAIVWHFGTDVLLDQVTITKAKQAREHWLSRYAEATVANFVKKSRQVFGAAVDDKLIAENPFAPVTAGSFENPARMFYVPREWIERMLIHDSIGMGWKLIFAAARFQGLRVPSETSALRWQDIDFANNQITIHSSKTEHHVGKDKRIMPLFDELRQLLLGIPDIHRVPGHLIMPAHYNNRDNAIAATKLAGLDLWPRLFQNLRSSCETDLADDNPIFVVCKWIGNSPRIASKHYFQVTPEHHEKALAANAAKRAALSVALGRTSSESRTRIAANNAETAETVTPVECNSRHKSLDYLQKHHKALQKTLRLFERYAENQADADITVLTKQVKAAIRRSRKAGGR